MLPESPRDLCPRDAADAHRTHVIACVLKRSCPPPFPAHCTKGGARKRFAGNRPQSCKERPSYPGTRLSMTAMPGKQWSSWPSPREHRPHGTPPNGTRPRMGVRGLKGEGGLVGSPFPWDGPGRETRAQGEGGVRSAGCETTRCFSLRRSLLATSYRILTFLCSVNLSKLESLLKLTNLDLCTTLKSSAQLLNMHTTRSDFSMCTLARCSPTRPRGSWNIWEKLPPLLQCAHDPGFSAHTPQTFASPYAYLARNSFSTRHDASRVLSLASRRLSHTGRLPDH